MNSSAAPYYQVVFIRMKDAGKFARYLELMAPIVRRYGGELERSLAARTMHTEALPKPDAINVVFYDNRAAFTAFNQDPEFREIEHLRSESIEMSAIGGFPIGGVVTDDRVAERLYLLEIARFGPSGVAGYRNYEARAERVMRHFGYHVERVLEPDNVSGFPFTPDIVKLAYFDSPAGMERLHQHPAHGSIETELYPSAVAESIWVTAAARELS
jgi:uncharacterized protein (DUF1330 family)